MDTICLPAHVRSRRRAAGLSQQKLAQLAGCSVAAVRLFDRGYTPDHSEVLARVGAVLDRLEGEGPAEAA